MPYNEAIPLRDSATNESLEAQNTSLSQYVWSSLKENPVLAGASALALVSLVALSRGKFLPSLLKSGEQAGFVVSATEKTFVKNSGLLSSEAKPAAQFTSARAIDPGGSAVSESVTNASAANDIGIYVPFLRTGKSAPHKLELFSRDNPAARIYSENGGSIVRLFVQKEGDGSLWRHYHGGSGFFLGGKESKIIGTANHVVNGRVGESIFVSPMNRLEDVRGNYLAKVIKVDESQDLAILEITHRQFERLPRFYRGISEGKFSDIKPGEHFLSLGVPMEKVDGVHLAFGQVKQVGPVSNIFSAGEIPPSLSGTVIRGESTMRPGMSGGPIFDTQGRFAGVNSFVIRKSMFHLPETYYDSGFQPARKMLELLDKGIH